MFRPSNDSIKMKINRRQSAKMPQSLLATILPQQQQQDHKTSTATKSDDETEKKKIEHNLFWNAKQIGGFSHPISYLWCAVCGTYGFSLILIWKPRLSCPSRLLLRLTFNIVGACCFSFVNFVILCVFLLFFFQCVVVSVFALVDYVCSVVPFLWHLFDLYYKAVCCFSNIPGGMVRLVYI